MLIIEMAKIELTGGHIGFIVLYRLPECSNYRDGQNRINRRPYWIYAIIEMAKIESTGGHIEIMLVIDYQEKINMINYRDGQNRINRRPYWIYYIKMAATLKLC